MRNLVKSFAFAPLLGLALLSLSSDAFAAGPKVVIVSGDTTGGPMFQTLLQGTGVFGLVDLINATSATPTLPQLEAYQGVLVLGYSWLDRTALGNVMADYVDGGGGVVVTMWTLTSSYDMLGRWKTGGYWCIDTTATYTASTLVGLKT